MQASIASKHRCCRTLEAPKKIKPLFNYLLQLHFLITATQWLTIQIKHVLRIRKISSHVLSAADSLTKGPRVVSSRDNSLEVNNLAEENGLNSGTGRHRRKKKKELLKWLQMKMLHNQIRYSVCHSTESLTARSRISIDWLMLGDCFSLLMGVMGVGLLRNCVLGVVPVCMYSVFAWRNLVLGIQKQQRRYRTNVRNWNLFRFLRYEIAVKSLIPLFYPSVAQMLQGQYDIFANFFLRAEAWIKISLLKIYEKQHIWCIIGFSLGNLRVLQSGRIKETGRTDCK